VDGWQKPSVCVCVCVSPCLPMGRCAEGLKRNICRLVSVAKRLKLQRLNTLKEVCSNLSIDIYQYEQKKDNKENKLYIQATVITVVQLQLTLIYNGFTIIQNAIFKYNEEVRIYFSRLSFNYFKYIR